MNFKTEFKKLAKDEFKIIKETKKKAKVKCLECGNEIYKTKSMLLYYLNNITLCRHRGKSKNTEQFKKEVFDLAGNEYSVLGKYKNAKTKILIKHNICGHEWEVRPVSFTSSGSRCPKCAIEEIRQRKIKTHNQYMKDVKKLTKNEFEVLGKYNRSNEKIKIKHKKCGHIFKDYAAKFLQIAKCPQCKTAYYASGRKSDEQFIKEVYDLVGDEYTFLENYKGATTRIKLRHNKCGYKYKITPSVFLNNKDKYPNCPNCGTTLKTQEKFKKEIKNTFGNEYTILSKYKGANKMIKIKHTSCGHIYETKASQLLYYKEEGQGCPNCGTSQLSHKEYVDKVYDQVGDEYIVVGKYNGARNKIKMKHNICDNVYETYPYHILQGHGCPECSFSHGENLISDYLKTDNIKYESQYTFNDCLDIRKLRFDFAVFDNKKLKLLIEYDGKQHYEPVDFAGKGEKWASQRHEMTKRKDEIKNDYCQNNNIPLLRIPYWEKENISEILNTTLSHFGIKKYNCLQLSLFESA